MTVLPTLGAALRNHLAQAARWFVLTGAGISAESGIPTFRGAGGLWEGARPEVLASAEGFRRDPALVWRWYRWRRGIVLDAAPNAGHGALAALERRVRAFCLATQNVDGLHRRAGSREVLELHGSILRARCFEGCGARTDEDPAREVPLCRCGAPLRPDVVWFGEALPEEIIERAFREAERCEACLVVGTSGVVHPAAALPLVARRASAAVIEINPEDTPLSAACDATLRGPAAEILPALVRMLGLAEELPRTGGV